MTDLTGQIRIQAPQQQVWAALADLGSVYRFHPGVSRSYYSTEQLTGVGAARICELLPMGKVEETAVAWQEGEAFTLSITPIEKAPPLKFAQAILSLASDGRDTIVTLKLDYELKYGFLGSLMNAVMVKPQFTRVIPSLLGGLKHYVETGEEVSADVWRRVRPALA